MAQSEDNKEKFSKDVIQNTYDSLIQGLTGLATSEKKELIFSISNILQRIRGTNLLGVFKEEWEYWKGKGKIKDDYHRTEQHLNCLHELFEFLDKDIPDDLRFNVLKKILLVAASEKKSTRTDIIPQQFMRISKRLSAGELVVLFTAYKLAKKHNFNYQEKRYGAREWLQIIADNSDLKYVSLVELNEKKLMDLRLITDRTYGDGSGVQYIRKFRLSDLGIEFCNYIESYESIKP